MIVASKERYLPVMVNVIVLAQANWYFYVHRDVFEQATILMSKYRNLQEMADAFGGIRCNAATVDWFFDEAPKPLHMLAPYLSLVEGELECDIEQCCGTLHVISSMISVLNFIGKPADIRRSVSFSPFVREEYEYAWDCFLSSCVPYSSLGRISGAQQTLRVSPASPERLAVAAADAPGQQTTALFPQAASTATARGRTPSAAGKQASEVEKSALRQLLTGSGGST